MKGNHGYGRRQFTKDKWQPRPLIGGGFNILPPHIWVLCRTYIPDRRKLEEACVKVLSHPGHLDDLLDRLQTRKRIQSLPTKLSEMICVEPTGEQCRRTKTLLCCSEFAVLKFTIIASLRQNCHFSGRFRPVGGRRWTS